MDSTRKSLRPWHGRKHNRAKTTGFKVTDNTKRKAERAMKEIIAMWEKEANADIITSDPLFSEYVKKWLEKKRLVRKENTIKS